MIVDTEDPEVKTKIVSHIAVCQFDDDLVFRASSYYYRGGPIYERKMLKHDGKIHLLSRKILCNQLLVRTPVC